MISIEIWVDWLDLFFQDTSKQQWLLDNEQSYLVSDQCRCNYFIDILNSFWDTCKG